MNSIIKAHSAKEEIAALYAIYQDNTLSDADLSELQDLLIELAQEKMHTKVVEQKRFDWANEDDRASLRVLYELALAHYAEGMLYESTSEFEILSVISNDETFSISMKKHLFALDQGLGFDDVVNEWIEDTGYTFFMKEFDRDFEKQFNEHLERIDQKLEKTRKLFK